MKQVITSIVVLFGLIFSQFVYADETQSHIVLSPELAEAQTWLMTYYEHPDPSQVPAVIKTLAQAGLLTNDSTNVAVIAALAQIIRQNPNHIALWMAALDVLNESEKEALIIAIWQSKTSQGNLYLSNMAKNPMSALDYFAKAQRLKSHVDILKAKVRSPADIESLWGSYYATGDARYVIKIINEIGWVAADGEDEAQDKRMQAITLVSAARWSLTTNAMVQPAVYAIAEAYLPEAGPELKPTLQMILETADEAKRREGLPEPPPGAIREQNTTPESLFTRQRRTN